jgi:hypothetical protein
MLLATIAMLVFVVVFSAATSYDGQHFHWRQFSCMLVLGAVAWFFGLMI